MAAEKFNIKVVHILCKFHLNQNISRKLAMLKLSNLSSHDSHFRLFIHRLKSLVFLPSENMKDFLLYCIAQVAKEGHTYENFNNYLVDKYTQSFCDKASYFKLLKDFNGTYLNLSNNIAESLNHSVNSYILTLSKSKDLNTILTRLRMHYVVTIRNVETQILAKKSDYSPSAIALERFQKAKSFVNKISAMKMENNEKCFKKVAKLIDIFYDEQ